MQVQRKASLGGKFVLAGMFPAGTYGRNVVRFDMGFGVDSAVCV